MEEEQIQQLSAISESASATSVAYIGDHVERSHRNNNQALINQQGVTACACVTFSLVVVNMHLHNLYAAAYCIV